MGLEEILARIDADARSGAESILEQGRRAAEGKREAWISRGRAEAAAILHRAGDEAERLKRQAQAEAKFESGKAILGRKRELLGQVTSQAWRRLMEDEPDLHRQVLAKLMERWLPGADSALFSGDPLGREAATRKLHGVSARMEAAPPGAPPRGGLIIRRGPVTHDFSFDRLMEELASRHLVEIQRILFGKEHA